MDSGTAGASDAANGTSSRLLRDDWKYVGAIPLDEFEASDFALLDAQRPTFTAERQAGADPPHRARAWRTMPPSATGSTPTGTACSRRRWRTARARTRTMSRWPSCTTSASTSRRCRTARFVAALVGPYVSAGDGMAAGQPRRFPEHALPQPPGCRPLRAGEVARPPGVRDDGRVLREVRPERDGPGLRQHADGGVRADGAAPLRQGTARGPADRAMRWIRRIEYEESSGALRALYDRDQGISGGQYRQS